MNVYNITWVDHGNVVARNMVIEDPRPTQIEADDYELVVGSDGGLGGIKFFRGENTEPFLIIFDIPLMVQRVGS